MSVRQKKLPIAALERIDQRCAAFEDAWRQGEPRAIASFLDDACDEADEKEALLAELILLEVDYRRRKGEQPTAEDYLAHYPEQAEVIHDALQTGHPKTGSFTPPSIDSLASHFPTLEIVELLGAGGMAAVYKARQKGLDRWVALKVLPPELAHDSRFALRFTREARALAKLTHPNIVSLYEFGKAGDTYYFLMEFVDGTTLRDVIRTGRLSPQQALLIVPQLCDALQVAHEQGVIHRDIKPENILLARSGGVKIADFGLSRILGSDSQASLLTQTHQVMGTPRYMAPEQFQGTHGVDHRADIYSLGVVFYEMLTGELPVGRFAPPSQKVAVDVRLDDVVLRTLETEPQRRYQRASQIKSDVESITSTESPAMATTQPLGDAIHQPIPQTQPQPAPASLEQQAIAGQLLLTRRDLTDRVRASLGPLFRWQLVQIVIGVLLIALGVWCWAPHTHLPHKLASGLVLHVYGVLLIASAANVCTKIRRLDTSASVADIRKSLCTVETAYVRWGPLIGFSWWLLWIPVAVALGFDPVLHPNSLIPSLVVGVVGMAGSLWLTRRAACGTGPRADAWRKQFAGRSLAAARGVLDEMEKAGIQ